MAAISTTLAGINPNPRTPAEEQRNWQLLSAWAVGAGASLDTQGGINANLALTVVTPAQLLINGAGSINITGYAATLTLTNATESVHTVFIAGTSGSTTPTFRLLQSADVATTGLAAGYYLTTDGTNNSWAAISVPVTAASGLNGVYLNGSTLTLSQTSSMNFGAVVLAGNLTVTGGGTLTTAGAFTIAGSAVLGGSLGIGASPAAADIGFGSSVDRVINVADTINTIAGKSITIRPGNTVNTGVAAFTALSQTSRVWRDMAAAPNGDIYCAVQGGDIYKQTGGSGNFVALSQTSRTWVGMCASTAGNVYASANVTDIYMQTAGAGNFIALSAGALAWRGMAAAPNGDVYVCVDTGDIYKQTGGTGAFNALSQTSRSWREMTAAPNGDIYAAVFGGDIYKQTGGVGNFVALSQTSRNWVGLAADASGNIWASANVTDIYLQTAGAGNFVAQSIGALAWREMCGDASGNVYVCVDSGDIYKRTATTGTANLAGGSLVLSVGLGKGNASSVIVFETCAPLASGTTMQTRAYIGTVTGTGWTFGGTVTAATIVDSALTAGRLLMAGTSGVIQNTSINVTAGAMTGVTSINLFKPGGVLFDDYADAGNGTTVETDLYTHTLAAGQLASNGDKIYYEAGGVFVSSATATRQLKLYFGGTAIFDSGALTLSLSSAWTIYALIIRVSATVVRYEITMTTEGAALAAYTATGELTGLTLSGTNVAKITGQAAGVGAATNDIVAKLGTISYQPGA